MADKMQEPAANLRTKDQIKVKEEKYGKNVVEAQPAKEQKLVEAKVSGVESPKAPKVGADRDVGKEVADEDIAVSRIGSQPQSFTKPSPNSNETTYTKELIVKELVLKAKEEDVPTYHMRRIAKRTLRMPDAMVGVMGGPNKEEARKTLGIKKARDPYAVATAVAERMGYTNFKEGSAGQKKRDEIAESIEAKKAMAFPKHGLAAKITSAKGRREELDAEDRGQVDEEKCSLQKDEVLVEILEKAAGIAGFQPTADVRVSKDKDWQKSLEEDSCTLASKRRSSTKPSAEQLGLKPETQLKFHMSKSGDDYCSSGERAAAVIGKRLAAISKPKDDGKVKALADHFARKQSRGDAKDGPGFWHRE